MSAMLISACHTVENKEKYHDIANAGTCNNMQSDEPENNDIVMETSPASYKDKDESEVSQKPSDDFTVGHTDSEDTRIKGYNNTDNNSKSSAVVKDDAVVKTSRADKSTYSEENETTKAYIVGTDVRKVINSSEMIKYGATRKNITEYTYEVYSDDSRKEVSHISRVVIDRSTYCATDDILKEEAEYNALSYTSLWNEILRCINSFRADNNMDMIVLDENLCKAACMRAVEIDYSAYFSHIRPDGRSAFTTLDYFGCVAGFKGENLAGGQRTPELAVKAWEESDKGHRELLLNPKIKKMGCGYSYSGTIGYPVWTLEMTD